MFKKHTTFSNTFLAGSLLLLSAYLGPPVAWGANINCEPDGTDTLIQYGDKVSCTFSATDDIDIFRFTGKAGDQPFISFKAPDGRFGGDMYLYGPQGQYLTSGSTSSEIKYTLPEDGTYTLLIEFSQFQINANREFPVNYTLQLPCVFGSCVAALPPALLGYIPVEPCRIVDTRYGGGGTLSAQEERHFHAYGEISEQNGAGTAAPPEYAYPTECAFPFPGEPHAVHLNVTVVPNGAQGEQGHATIWPWNTTRPAASWINYQAGAVGQNIANSGTVKTTRMDVTDPDFSVFTHRSADFVIDVLGYYTR